VKMSLAWMPSPRSSTASEAVARIGTSGEDVSKWQRDGYGVIVLQANVEDTRLGAQEYGIRELGVKAVELKWDRAPKISAAR